MKHFIFTFCVTAITLAAVCPSHASLVTESTVATVAIPDNSPNAGAASGIYIDASHPQLAGIVNPYVASMSITFSIMGGWAGDYTLVLKHVDANGLASQSSTLFSSLLGGAAANSGFGDVNGGVTLTSGAGTDTAVPSDSSTAAITGTMYGINFSPFQNVAPTGDWILYATDNAGGFNGTLGGWTLNMEVVPEPVNMALGVFGGLMGLVVLVRIQRAKKQKS